jgi:ornithine carbamoyltransferase
MIARIRVPAGAEHRIGWDPAPQDRVEDEMAKKDFVSIADCSRASLDDVLERARVIKEAFLRHGPSDRLRGKTLGMIFHKPSLRTRVSFDAGMAQMGGSAFYISEREIGLDSRETLEDVARVLSGYVDAIMIRTFAHAFVERLAAAATVPVINGLTDLLHPCQILADLMTIRELGKPLDGIAIAYVGDGNNVAHSWINAAIHYRLDLQIAHPEGYGPNPDLTARARTRGAQVRFTHDPGEAGDGADVVYTDVWASMGQEAERERRLRDFRGFRVDAALMARAKPDAIFMHCLPAHRGEEVAADVIDGAQSVVFREAHNRLHAQKGLLDLLLA